MNYIDIGISAGQAIPVTPVLGLIMLVTFVLGVISLGICKAGSKIPAVLLISFVLFMILFIINMSIVIPYLKDREYQQNAANEPAEMYCYNTTQVEKRAASNNIPIFKVAEIKISAVHTRLEADGLLSSAEIQQDNEKSLIKASDPESFISIAKQINATEIYYVEGGYGGGAYKTYVAYQDSNERVLLESKYPTPYIYNHYAMTRDDANDRIIFRKTA